MRMPSIDPILCDLIYRTKLALVITRPQCISTFTATLHKNSLLSRQLLGSRTPPTGLSKVCIEHSQSKINIRHKHSQSSTSSCYKPPVNKTIVKAERKPASTLATSILQFFITAQAYQSIQFLIEETINKSNTCALIRQIFAHNSISCFRTYPRAHEKGQTDPNAQSWSSLFMIKQSSTIMKAINDLSSRLIGLYIQFIHAQDCFITSFITLFAVKAICFFLNQHAWQSLDQIEKETCTWAKQ